MRRVLLFLILLQPLSAQALEINLFDGGGAAEGTDFRAGYEQAARIWEEILKDDVTVNISVRTDTRPTTSIGETAVQRSVVNYSDVLNQLASDVTSANDAMALAQLPTGNSIDFLVNQVDGSVVLDNDQSNNNNFLWVPNANLKALNFGITPGELDGTITANEALVYDFDVSDGVDADKFDFVGFAFHSIGHVLGFISGVDTIDLFTGVGANAGDFTDEQLNDFAIFTILDLFRFSDDALAVGPDVRDFSIEGLEERFLSIDGNNNSRTPMTLGLANGDGFTADHFQVGFGMMDPLFPAGMERLFTENDAIAFDVIGWDFTAKTNGIPEPTTAALLLLGVPFVRRRRTRESEL